MKKYYHLKRKCEMLNRFPIIGKIFLMTAIVCLFLSVGEQAKAQTVQLGTGTQVHTDTEASPVNIYYRRTVMQFVYTVSELNSAGATGMCDLDSIGWYVDIPPIYDIPDYTVKMKHVTDANVSNDLGNTGWTTVINPFLYSPASGWDTLALDQSFSWNGSQNIGVEICWSQVMPGYDASGQCRVYSETDGFIFNRTDAAGTSCGETPATNYQFKPQAIMSFSNCTAISCNIPINLSAANITGVSADLDWTEQNTATQWEIEWGTQGFTQGTGTDSMVTSKPATVSGLNPLSGYEYYVRSICAAGDTSFWSGPYSFSTPFYCPPGAYCFTTGGAVGAFGPTQSQLDQAYSGTNLDTAVISNNGIQEWQVPLTSMYRITAYGASGGEVPRNQPGSGAVMSGDFTLQSGQDLRILVGQEGVGSATTFHGGGGGGGSFVWDFNNDSLPLIAAGGGAGGGNSTSGVTSSKHATDSINGQANGDGFPGGINGQGGLGGNSGTWGGGGGAGWFSNGGDDGTYGKGGFTPLNGGQGGPVTGSSQNEGGFGGGGSDGYDGGGAGGGFSGGAGGGYSGHTYRNGGGGGSYNAGVNQQNFAAQNSNQGYVVIEPLIGPHNLDARVIDFVGSAPFCGDSNTVLAMVIHNYGSDSISGFDVTIDWTGSATGSASVTYTDTLASGNMDTVIVDTVNTFPGGTFNLTGYTQLSGDQDTSNDTLTSGSVTFEPGLTTPTLQTSAQIDVCWGNDAQFVASAAQGNIEWRDLTGNTITSGDTLSLINNTVADTFYALEVTASGCEGPDVEVSMNIDTLPSVHIGSDTVYCEGDAINHLLNAGSGNNYSYLWNDSSTSQTLSGDTAGIYWAEVTDGNNCSRSDTVIITEEPLPQPDLGANLSYCEGDTTFGTYLVAGVSASSYLWSDGSGGSFLQIDTAGTYWVEVTTATGCVGSDTITVTENQLPVVDLGSDLEFCSNETFTANLDAGGHTDVTYMWSDGSTDETLMIDSADTYWVEVTDTNTMCSYTETIEVTELIAPNVAVENDTVCEGEEATLDAGTGFDSYNWSTGESTSSINVTAQGEYFVTVTNDKGCEDSASAMVELLPAPMVNLGQDTALNEDEVAVLDAPGGMRTYNWNTGDTTESLEVQYGDVPNTFWVEVMNNDGCFGSDTIFIDQNVSAGAENLFNGDIKVYPNPVRNDANLEINLTKNGTLEIDVFSMSGQILKTKRVGGNAGDNFVPVEMNNLSKGMYMIRVRLDGERLGVFNISKM